MSAILSGTGHSKIVVHGATILLRIFSRADCWLPSKVGCLNRQFLFLAKELATIPSQKNAGPILSLSLDDDSANTVMLLTARSPCWKVTPAIGMVTARNQTQDRWIACQARWSLDHRRLGTWKAQHYADIIGPKSLPRINSPQCKEDASSTLNHSRKSLHYNFSWKL